MDAQARLSTCHLELTLSSQGGRLSLDSLRAGGVDWLHPLCASGLFAAWVDGERWDASNLEFAGLSRGFSPLGPQGECVAHLRAPGFEVDLHVLLYPDSSVLELRPVLRATRPCRVTRLDSFSLDLRFADLDLLSFSSNWGAEFEPQPMPLRAALTLEERGGRSSRERHPWFALTAPDGSVFSASMAWSGNWALRFEPLPEGWRACGGLNDWQFEKPLAPGEAFEAPPAVLVFGRDLNAVAQQYARTGRRWWYPHSPLSDTPAVEWNHWWSYEDRDIDEQTFLANAEAAAGLGIELCTLDAGWFGPPEAGTGWFDWRGDWETVNNERFPGGMRMLSERVHALGMAFGLWCEIEGLGAKSRLGRERPELAARRGGSPLGYVCLGAPAAQEWAYATLARLIEDYGCDWIKLDFNLDPGAGCDRPDHGHAPGEGLYAHVNGYYRLLDRLRQRYPAVTLEACASGGLRLDLGLLRHTHLAFLSDPDWPVHSLQVFWGASLMFAPSACLHWSFSEWLKDKGYSPQNFSPHSPHLTPARLDYYTRIAMLGAFGLSQKLPELPNWVARRLAQHIRLYKEQVRRFVLHADLFRLTAQPRRDGSGERWAAFQYSLAESNEHLLFVFRLPGGEPRRRLRLVGLEIARDYSVEGLEGEFRQNLSGRELVEDGLLFDQLGEEESALLLIKPGN